MLGRGFPEHRRLRTARPLGARGRPTPAKALEDSWCIRGSAPKT